MVYPLVSYLSAINQQTPTETNTTTLQGFVVEVEPRCCLGAGVSNSSRLFVVVPEECGEGVAVSE